VHDLFTAILTAPVFRYGGSQLVNRIQTYRKSSPWTSHTRDILNTVARYYSNSFTDAEKQDAMNVFLGIFVPRPGEPALWELESDYFLHHRAVLAATAEPRPRYTHWLEGVPKNGSCLLHLFPASTPAIVPPPTPGALAATSGESATFLYKFLFYIICPPIMFSCGEKTENSAVARIRSPGLTPALVIWHLYLGLPSNGQTEVSIPGARLHFHGRVLSPNLPLGTRKQQNDRSKADYIAIRKAVVALTSA
jgi:hypothetical protein